MPTSYVTVIRWYGSREFAYPLRMPRTGKEPANELRHAIDATGPYSDGTLFANPCCLSFLDVPRRLLCYSESVTGHAIEYAQKVPPADLPDLIRE